MWPSFMQKIELKKQVLLTFKVASFHKNKSSRDHTRLDLEFFPICEPANCWLQMGFLLSAMRPGFDKTGLRTYDVSITHKEASQMQDLQDWISRYLLDCKYQKDLDSKTLKAYRIDLEQFSALISQNNLGLTREGLMEYISDLHQRYKPRTVKRKIASVKAFCGYLEYEELVRENPFSRLRLKMNPPLILPRAIPLPVIEAVLTAAYQAREEARTSEQQKSVLRDIAVLELLFATGVRVSELCALQYGDVRLDEGEIKIYGKGAKERFVQIANQDVLNALCHYRENYKDAIEQAGAFFVNRSRRPLSTQSVRAIVNKYCKLAGVESHITPHMFRHSFATLLLDEGVDIRYIQQLLGHSSIVTTQIYTHVAGKKQRDILSEKHPRNKIHSM